MPYVIAEPCIDVMDRSCIEECPVDCSYEGGRTLYINPLAGCDAPLGAPGGAANTGPVQVDTTLVTGYEPRERNALDD